MSHAEQSDTVLPRGHYDDASWLLMLFLACAIAAFQAVEPFGFTAHGAISPAVFILILACVARFYRILRPRPHIADMVICLQQLILFSCLGAALSYMVAAQGGALWDAQFQQWDRALGLNWRTMLDWENDRPRLAAMLNLAYGSLMPQMVTLTLALGFAGRIEALRRIVFAAMLAGTVTVLLSGVMPAVANYVFLGLTPGDYPNLAPAASFVHLADLQGLRAGTLRTISLDTVQGIITFPSYHAALATVFACGFWHAPVVRWPGVVVATLTLLATPIDGGHYFVDVIAGSMIAAASLWLARRAVTLNVARLIASHRNPRRAQPA